MYMANIKVVSNFSPEGAEYNVKDVRELKKELFNYLSSCYGMSEGGFKANVSVILCNRESVDEEYRFQDGDVVLIYPAGLK